MFKTRSKVLFVTAILAALYAIYIISYFYGANAESDDLVEEAGAAIATALVMPHMVMMGLGAIFTWLGFFLKAPWGALVGAILFCVGTVCFPMYAMFSVPLLILGFIAFSKQKKINKRNPDE